MSIPRSAVVVAVGSVFLLSGCARMLPGGPLLAQRSFVPIESTVERIASPALNQEAVAQVGDNMIESGQFHRKQAIRLLNPINHQGVHRSRYLLVIPAGILVASGNSGADWRPGTYFEAQQPLQFSGGSGQVRGGVFLPDNESLFPAVYWHATDTGRPLVDSTPAIRFERTIHESWQTDSFRRELIYNGRSGPTIKLLYREFIEERIRPAFSQEVSYDLAKGQTIGFKGARFQVLDADNVRIRYVVLRHFD